MAQKALYDMYARSMAAVCMRYVADRDTALDLMHDGFILLFDKIGQYKGEGAFEGWMRRLFTNVALEYLRKNDVLRGSDDVEVLSYTVLSEEETPIERMSAAEIVDCINSLPPTPRTVFNMFAVDGYSHAEIAKALGIPEVTVRSHYLRARRALQKMIEELGSERDRGEVYGRKTV